MLYLPALSSSLPVVTDAVDADSCAAAALAEPELEPALFLVDSGEGDLCRLLLPGCGDCRAGGLKIFTPQGLLQIVVSDCYTNIHLYPSFKGFNHRGGITFEGLIKDAVHKNDC